MKTSGASSNPPIQNKSEGTSKTGQKDKTQKEFKEVLQESGGKAKRKQFLPLGKKGVAVDSHTHGSHKSGLKPYDPKLVDRARVGQAEQQKNSKMKELPEGETEDSINPKMKRQGESETPTPVINPTPTVPSSVHTETKVEKVQNPGLNINEIQSIVNKVQVGINEKGLPECRFEIETKNLGTLDLKVSAEKDQIRIEFVTEDANAQRVLEDNLKDLGQMLRDKGLNLAETKFTPRDQQDSQQQQQSSGGDGDDAYPIAPPTGPKRGFSL